MKILTRTIEPFQLPDGSWDVRMVESMEEYPVDKERDVGFCNVCGDKRYPDCISGCIHRRGIPLKEGWDV